MRALSAFALGCTIAAGMVAFSGTPTFAQAKVQRPRSSAEYTLSDRGALAQVDVDVTDASAASALHEPVTDMVLFLSKSGADLGKLLRAADGENPDGGAGSVQGLFHARLFVVAAGRLYTGATGQCSPWSNGVSLCSAGCDGGTFALRRNGGAPLEVLIGAVPGGPAGEGPGLTISACSFDEAGDAKIKVKAGRGLAVIGFTSD